MEKKLRFEDLLYMDDRISDLVEESSEGFELKLCSSSLSKIPDGECF